jgi:hypothetical protein
MKFAIARGSTVALVLLGLTSSHAETTQVKTRVLVRAKPERIGEVWLGKTRCQVSAIEPGVRSPALIILEPSPSLQSRMYAELQHGLSGRQWTDFEIWVNGATSEHTARAEFNGRWVGAALDQSLGSTEAVADWRSARGGQGVLWMFEQIGRRFSGYGPVRVFWIDSVFSWLDSESPPVTRNSAFAPILGDAGMALFPVRIESSDPNWMEPKIRKSTSASEFGVEEIVAGREPGEALRLAIRESEAWSAVTLRVPALSKQRQSVTRELKVLDKNSRAVLFRRPFAASGVKAALPPSQPGEMDLNLCRLVRRLRFGSASLGSTCTGEAAESASEGYIRLLGVDFEPDEPQHSEVMISRTEYGKDMSRGFSQRNGAASLHRIGHDGACIGPIPLRRADVYVYSPAQRWLALVQVGR